MMKNVLWYFLGDFLQTYLVTPGEDHVQGDPMFWWKYLHDALQNFAQSVFHPI
jgi:hypothetical protein